MAIINCSGTKNGEFKSEPTLLTNLNHWIFLRETMTEEFNDEQDNSISNSHPIPKDELPQYRVERDFHLEQDIANYVISQAPVEIVQNVEKVKQEIVLGETYEIWDVITDKNRWWVITNLTNLYSQKHFPSLDYTLSFHIGLMMRLRSRPDSANVEEQTPFDEVFRRQEQVKNRLDSAIEPEDYQVVGMQLRECLLSLIGVLRQRVSIAPDIEKPQDANFIEWSSILLNALCGSRRNQELRQYLKNTASHTWQLVNWLTHCRNADKTSASIALYACDTVVGHFIQILEREKIDQTNQCPVCHSRKIRTHFDISIEPDGDYFLTCGVCGWSNHPNDA